MAEKTARRTPGAPVREPVAAWKRDLEEFAQLYHAFYRQVVQRLEAYPSAHLRDLVAADANRSQTNCGWTTYEVAPLVASEARRILYARKTGAMQEPSVTSAPSGEPR